jgi:putative oxidoreductase
LANFYQAAQGFPDVLHVGSPALNLALSLSAEALCAALLAVGLFTRAAAIPLVVNMAVAFALVHGLQLSGDGSGELAFIYLGAFVTVLATGPGRYSLDAVLFTWPLRRSTPDAAQSDSWPGSPTASPAPVSRR